MMNDVDQDEDPYVACMHCGKMVFAGVSDCPYCFKDPSGEISGCSHCGRDLPPETAQCPYCGNFTDDRGPAVKKQGLSRTWIIAGWLAIFGTIAPLLLALWQWIHK